MLSSNLSPKIVAGRRCSCPDSYFHSAYKFGTRILAHVYGLLGPCFKTGRMTPCRSTQRRKPAYRNTLAQLLVPVRTEVLPARQARESSRPHKRSPCPVSESGLKPKLQRRKAFHRARTRVDNCQEMKGVSSNGTVRRGNHSATTQRTEARDFPSLSQAQVPYACITTVSGTFNSLSKVLCTFPSRYLFAIGLELVLSFGWNVPPA